jgi:hypothetical protein
MGYCKFARQTYIMDEIVNKVKNSGLIQKDLAEYKPRMPFYEIDLSEQLWQGLILKEKDFRQWLKDNDWAKYDGGAVWIHCSSDAILPAWAFMLVVSKLTERSIDSIVGTKEDLEKMLIKRAIEKENLDNYQDAMMSVKGCSDIHSIEFAMSEFVSHFQKAAKSIMFGEPCSTVPVYKRGKKE